MKKYFFILFLLLISNLSYAQWAHITNGLSNDDTYSLTFNGNKIFAGTYSKGVYYSSNSGANWVQTSLNNKDVRSLAVIGNNVVAGTMGSGIYYSTNNGTNWIQSNLTVEDVWSLAVIGNNIFAGTEHKGVYISNNNGVSWTQTAMNDKNANYLYANGTNLYAAVGVGGWGVFVSPNNGASWTIIGDFNIGTYSVALSGNYIYAGPYYGGIYVSSDMGVNWTSSSFNTGTAAAIAVSGNNVFAGTEGYGFKVSNDNGTTWIQKSEGMGSAYIMTLCIINNNIYAGTGNGVYKRPLSELIGINQISSEIPIQFSLYQNYPNPFNPTTKIRFEIPLSRGVDALGGRGVLTQLIIYDILGREVTTLINVQLQPGSYEVDFDGSNYPSGVYFYKLSTGDFTAVNKMVLLK